MLDEKTKELVALVALGASITANCQPCLDYHTTKARELGTTSEDILAAIAVGKQVRSGAAAKMDRFVVHHVVGEAALESTAGCDCR